MDVSTKKMKVDVRHRADLRLAHLGDMNAMDAHKPHEGGGNAGVERADAGDDSSGLGD